MRIQLQNMKKGSQSIADFVLQMKLIANQMLAGGGSISKEDLVSYVLGGLGPEYETLIVNLLTRPILPRLEEVKQHLIYYESRLEHNNCTTVIDYSPTFGPVSAHITHSDSTCHEPINEVQKFSTKSPIAFTSSQLHSTINNESQNIGAANVSASNSVSSGDLKFQQNVVEHVGFGKSRFKGKYKNTRPKCQICKKLGHMADVCYFRHNNSPGAIPNTATVPQFAMGNLVQFPNYGALSTLTSPQNYGNQFGYNVPNTSVMISPGIMSPGIMSPTPTQVFHSNMPAWNLYPGSVSNVQP